MSILSKDYFNNEITAIKYLEGILWSEGVKCPHCESTDRFYLLNGSSTRPGLRKCASCRKQFTVKVGTVFESSHIPLHKWLQATYLISSSKKGMSSHQLHRTLQITYKTAWFMMHRIREAMKATGEPLGGEGSMIEVDEIFIGGHTPGGHAGTGKAMALGILDREGQVLTQSIPNKRWNSVVPLINKNVKKGSIINSDGAMNYFSLPVYGYEIQQMNHKNKEYVRGENHTNNLEAYFSIFKRGMQGIYQHCSTTHLNKYLSEFDFRFNHKDISDFERFNILLKNTLGKRLTYRQA